RNYTAKALSVRVPLGYVEALPTLDASDRNLLLEENRDRYSAPPELPSETPFPSSPPRPPAQPQKVRTKVSPPPETADADAQPEDDAPQASATVPVSIPTVAQPGLRKKTPAIPKETGQSGK